MSKVTFTRKRPGSRGWTYFYKCDCEDGNEPREISVAASNDNSALLLAQQECSESCGEAIGAFEDQPVALQLARIRSDVDSAAYVVTLLETLPDLVVVGLCTGDEIPVPRSIIKSLRTIGKLSTEGHERLLCRLELDLSNSCAIPVARLANALQRTLGDVSGSSRDTKNPEVENSTIKMLTSGPACSYSYSYFDSKSDILDFRLNRVERCSLAELVRIGPRRLRAMTTGLPGTPCANMYGGEVYVDVATAG